MSVAASVPASRESPRVLFARQAIVDRRGRLAGYELLYRGPRGADGEIPDAEHATCSVLVGAFAEVGMGAAVGGATAFLNVTERFLREVDPLPLAPEATVLELLEDATPSPALMDRLRALRLQGFRVALDDFAPGPTSTPLLDVADIVKVDLRAHERRDAEKLMGSLAARGLKVVAEKVEDQDEFEWSRAAGAKLFQGYFFCKPVELAGAELRAASIERLRTVAGLTRPDVGFEAIEHAIKTDPHLALRLLQQLNSAAVSLPHRISSIRQGVVLLGPRTVRQWALVLLLSGIGEQRGPVLATALARARTLETLAHVKGAGDPDAWFSVGLLSVSDALAGAPLPEVVERLPLADDVRDALVHRSGPKGAALSAAIACERAELPETDRRLVMTAYADAIAWADATAAAA
ncbi:MAG TPA: EAL domain-containing protein [Baekduia sp.]|uniref:EAL and HDOD domain-containing protein n=1 Tax=Baekduia sp. TaxID=2600305 RepID=UPI002D776FF7|nr:EAL domain-containing protein [Baekduia sp.]HET6507514.1 EAL domain-containing protein [Baekduia sp.]